MTPEKSTPRPEIGRPEALNALNAIGLTPTAEETEEPYGQAFRLTPEASAIIAVLAQTSRRGHLRGHTQEELAATASAASSTVSGVVARLRRLGLVETAGGVYDARKRRRSILEYRLRWAPAMWLTDDRWRQAGLAAEALRAGLASQQIRGCLVRGAVGEKDLRAQLGQGGAVTPATAAPEKAVGS